MKESKAKEFFNRIVPVETQIKIEKVMENLEYKHELKKTCKKYEELIKKTNQYPTKNIPQLAVLALGFVSEVEEFINEVDHYSLSYTEEQNQRYQKALQSEAGDVLWYMQAISMALNFDLFELILIANQINMVSPVPPVNFAGAAKKYIRDNNPAKIKEIEKYFIWFIKYLEFFFKKEEIISVIENNINKLEKRLENNTIKGDGENR